MRSYLAAAALMAGALFVVGCSGTPVERVDVPSATDPSAYQPQPMPKPLPPEGYDPTVPQPPAPPPAPTSGQPVPPPPTSYGQPQSAAPFMIQNEPEFVQAYENHRSPRMMVFVNRTTQGDSIEATSDDYDLIEASIIKYFDNSGKVTIQDSDAARAKLNRESVLRIENGDPAAVRLLATELQQDILIRVSAKPTTQSSWGQAVRLIAKAVSTTDGRILGEEFTDMPLPLSKTNINVATRYLSEHLMGDMTQKWSANPDTDTIEVRVYKTAAVDDALKVGKWLRRTPGVSKVITRGATGGSTTAYAAFAVSYAGAPEDLYAGLQDEIGQSQGLKAVDLQNNTINLEVTGQLNLVTTTQKTETTTTTTTTEDKKIEPINAAPGQ